MARQHGISGYTGGCRCGTCKREKRNSLRNRYRTQAYGRPTTDLVDVAPVRAHIEALMASGASLDQISEQAGVSYGVLSRTLYLGQKRMKANSAQALLALASVDVSDSLARVEASGVRRRVQALAALGWSISWQARQVGMVPTDLHQIARGNAGATARTAARVRGLYDQYWDVLPEPSRSVSLVRRLASERGYLPPLAWDDDLIDLPDDEFEAELSRRVSLMDDEELRRCATAYKAEGEKSPEVVAAAREWRRRLGSQRLAA